VKLQLGVKHTAEEHGDDRPKMPPDLIEKY